jgi:hypothetical protein
MLLSLYDFGHRVAATTTGGGGEREDDFAQFVAQPGSARGENVCLHGTHDDPMPSSLHPPQNEQ